MSACTFNLLLLTPPQAANSFAEVILYLSATSGEVKAWLRSSKWSPKLTEDVRPLNVTVIVNEDSRTRRGL